MGKVHKSGTESSRKRHKFVSFREKVESIKIDPVRNLRRNFVDDADTSSYFIKALDYWTEMNLCVDFVEFSEKCTPLARSLPMILHNQKLIKSLLFEHIKNNDTNSLGSLLDLVTHFAHDLGPDFHPYFRETLQVVLDLSTSSDISIVEAAFNCLAYLFKYLSRLLTTDLRPTYDVISPLLGKTKQRKFVYRFTGESLGFLLRKCTGDSLNLIIRHIFDDVYSQKNDEFLDSIIHLLAESMKSAGTNVHSRTSVMLEALIKTSLDPAAAYDVSYFSRLVCGVVAELLHHSERETAAPVVSTVLSCIDECLTTTHDISNIAAEATMNYLVKLLVTLVSLRKGSRICKWSPVFQTTNQLVLKLVERQQSSMEDETLILVFGLGASLLNYSPAEVSEEWFGEIMKNFFKFGGHNFLVFVDLALREKPELAARMTTYVQRYIQSQSCVESFTGLFLYDSSKYPWIEGLPQLNNSSPFIKKVSQNIKASLDKADYPSLLWNLIVLRVTGNVSAGYLNRLAEYVVPLLTADYSGDSPESSLPLVSAVLGEIFRSIAAHENSSNYYNKFSRALNDNFSKFSGSLWFLKGVGAIVGGANSGITKSLRDLPHALIQSLRQPSHEFREASITILSRLHPKNTLLSSCQLIESLPRDVANARNITMHIRDMCANFSSTGTDPLLDEAVPAFLFGLLSDRFQPVWQGALDGIEYIASKNEAVVWENCHLLLEQAAYIKPMVIFDGGESSFLVQEPLEISRFAECTNIDRLLSQYVEVSSEFVDDQTCHQTLLKKEEPSNDFFIQHTTSRSLALKVLLKLPKVAEKHSDYFVPHMLWDINQEDLETDESSDLATPQVWAWKDRTVLLEIFSVFKNPKALPRWSEVYDRYLYLLANRNANVQKLSLKAILTFKNPVLRKYSENLSALLEDTQFKDEMLNLLVQSDGQEGTVHAEDRDEIMPVVVRIIFGKAQISKTGGVKQTRRFAVINALHNLEPKYISLFIDLSIGRLECSGFIQTSRKSKNFTLNESDSKFQSLLADDDSAEVLVRRELGFLTMLEDLVNILGSRLDGSLDMILNALIFSIWHTQHVDTKPSSFVGQSIRTIRTLGFKCLSGIFNASPGYNWGPYLDIIYSVMILPRLEDFDKISFHQESSLMKVFETVSNYSNLSVLLVKNDCQVLELLFKTLNHEQVVDPVIDCVLNIMVNILDLKGKADSSLFQKLVTTSVGILLPILPRLLLRSPVNSQLLEKESTILVKLLNDGYALDIATQNTLISVAFEALQRPSSQVRVTVKASMLDALAKLMDSETFVESQATEALEYLSPLFKQFRDRYVRTNLAAVINVLGNRFEKLSRIGRLVVELNAFSTKRLDVPDFDRRLPAFSDINDSIYLDLTPQEWLPILYNALYFMKDPEELALRTNATFTVKRFVDAVVHNSELLPILESLVLKEIRLGIRDTNEVIRVQYVEVLGHVVECRVCDQLVDMECLLHDHEEEANFFNNICHIQLHRRRRAVTRLAQFADEFKLREDNIAHYIMPLLEHYIVVKDDSFSHNLADDSIRVLSSLAKHISWSQYCAVLRRYLSYLNNSSSSDGDVSMKTALRLLDTMSTSLLTSQEEVANSVSPPEGSYGIYLASTLPKQDKLTKFISDTVLPTLMKILSPPRTSTGQIDDVNDDMSVRIPVALPVIKFMKSLPKDLLEVKLPGALSKVAQILKAKAQDTRDAVRKVLSKISALLGSEYLVFIIRELKSALTRGAHLHILGFTVHSLIAEMSSSLKYGDLDSSSRLIGEIVMEDIFGTTGSDKDEEGYTSKMKEVNQQKSYDTGVLVAQNIHLSSFGNLIGPVKTMLLFEKLTHKVELKVEELVRRYAQGLYHNEECSSTKFLVMSFELYKMVDDIEQQHEKDVEALKEKNRITNVKEYQAKQSEEFFTVQLDSRNWEAKMKRKYPQNLHIIRRFVLDALRVVLGKNEHLITIENLSGLLPMISSSLQSTYEDVQIAAIRVLALVVRLPFENADKDLAFYGRRAIEFIRSSTHTNTEICQASLRLLAVMIRSKKEYEIKESALSYILSRLQNDLEEPDRQGIAFTFIKAVLSRKIVISEVYDIMDKVGKVMITNQSHVIRDACRSAYFQFMTEYPQGQARVSKQMSFLVANLEYPATAGRLSVMEVMHLFFTKVDPDQIKSFLTSVFVGLVLVLVNDQEPECRENASLVICDILSRAGQQELMAIENFCLSWLSESNDNPSLAQGGLMVAGLFFNELGLRRSPKLLSTSVERVRQILSRGSFDFNADDSDDEEQETEWQLIYSALQLFNKMVVIDKDSAVKTSSENPLNEVWPFVEANLLYPHTWVRLSAARLMGYLYSTYDPTSISKPNELIDDSRNLQSSAYKFVRQLGAPYVSEPLATQIVKNLAFITKVWEEKQANYTRNLGSNAREGSSAGSSEDENEGSDMEESTTDDSSSSQQLAVDWLVDRLSLVLRNQKQPAAMKSSKKASAQLLALISQLINEKHVRELAEKFVLAYYQYSVTDDDRDKELHDLCKEALTLLQNRIGVTEFTKAYSSAKEIVLIRQKERRAKRAIEAVVKPDMFARRKRKKHMVKRDKRRQNKDADGYYHTKKKKYGN